MSEDTPQPEGRVIGLQPLCKYTVSGTFDSPYGGAFHHSLALLFAIGRQLVLSLGGWSPQIQTGFHVSGPTQVPTLVTHFFVYGTITLYHSTFQKI